jgi:hypothetical protein
MLRPFFIFAGRHGWTGQSPHGIVECLRARVQCVRPALASRGLL